MQDSADFEIDIPVPRGQKQPHVLITQQQDEYISFVACGGIMPDSDSAGIKITAQDFADQLGVHRNTMLHWRKTIPDFWDRVHLRQREIGGKDRLIKGWNAIYLKVAAGNVEAAKLYFKNFDKNYVDPTQKVEVDVTYNYVDLLKAAQREGIIEGELANATPALDQGADGQDQPTHPNVA